MRLHRFMVERGAVKQHIARVPPFALTHCFARESVPGFRILESRHPPLFVQLSKILKPGTVNHHPRAQQAALNGWGARSLAAHLNGFETFAPFAVAVLVAHISGAASGLVDILAVVFVVSRVLYVALYLADLASLRSLVWSVGWIVTLVLFLSPVV